MKNRLISALLGLSLFYGLSWGETQIRQIPVFSVHTDPAILRAHLKAGDPYRADCLIFLGIQAHMSEQIPETKAYFQEALQYVNTSMHPKIDSFIALASLGVLQIEEENNYAQGQEKLDQALSLTSAIEPEFRSFAADLGGNLSSLLLESGQPDNAKKILRQAFALSAQCHTCQETLQEMQQDNSSEPDYFKTQGRELAQWNTQTHIITVYLANGAGLKDWKPEYMDFAQQAFQSWTTASKNRFTFQFIDNPKLADVRLEWKQQFSPSDGWAIGFNRISFLGNSMLSNDIEISLHDNEGVHITSNEVYATLLHEIGHMLGLQGHSPYISDVMSPESVTTVISTRDIATLEHIYASKPTYTSPFGMTLAQFRNQNNATD